MQLSHTPYQSYLSGFGYEEVIATEVLRENYTVASLILDRSLVHVLSPLGDRYRDTLVSHWYGLYVEVAIQNQVVGTALVLRSQAGVTSKVVWAIQQTGIMADGGRITTYPTFPQVTYKLTNALVEKELTGVIVPDTTMNVRVCDFNIRKKISDREIPSAIHPPTPTQWPC